MPLITNETTVFSRSARDWNRLLVPVTAAPTIKEFGTRLFSFPVTPLQPLQTTHLSCKQFLRGKPLVSNNAGVVITQLMRSTLYGRRRRGGKLFLEELLCFAFFLIFAPVALVACKRVKYWVNSNVLIISLCP